MTRKVLDEVESERYAARAIARLKDGAPADTPEAARKRAMQEVVRDIHATMDAKKRERAAPRKARDVTAPHVYRVFVDNSYEFLAEFVAPPHDGLVLRVCFRGEHLRLQVLYSEVSMAQDGQKELVRPLLTEVFTRTVRGNV